MGVRGRVPRVIDASEPEAVRRVVGAKEAMSVDGLVSWVVVARGEAVVGGSLVSDVSRTRATDPVEFEGGVEVDKEEDILREASGGRVRGSGSGKRVEGPGKGCATVAAAVRASLAGVLTVAAVALEAMTMACALTMLFRRGKLLFPSFGGGHTSLAGLSPFLSPHSSGSSLLLLQCLKAIDYPAMVLVQSRVMSLNTGNNLFNITHGVGSLCCYFFFEAGTLPSEAALSFVCDILRVLSAESH